MRFPVVPLYARTLDISAAQIGLFNAAFFLMAGLLSMPMGLVSDRTGIKPVATAGVVVLALAAFSLYLCDTFPTLTLAYLFFGIGTAAFGPTMMSFVAHISPRTHLGRSYGWYTTALFCGMSLGPAAGGFMAQKTGFIPVFTAIGIILLIVLAVLVVCLPGQKPSMKTAAGAEQPASLKKLFQNRPLTACWLITLFACYGLGMFISFIPLHAHNLGLNVKQIGLVFFVQGLCNGLSRIPFGYLSDKVARRDTLVVIGISGYTASLAGFGLSQNLTHFIVSAILSGGSMGLAFTSVGALIAEVVPVESRGVAMGGYNTCIYFGMMLSSACMGGVVQAIGFANGFYVTALLNAAAVGAFALLFKRQ
jgi:MFS transporter, DHA1 family, multidrug resistance protein